MYRLKGNINLYTDRMKHINRRVYGFLPFLKKNPKIKQKNSNYYVIFFIFNFRNIGIQKQQLYRLIGNVTYTQTESNTLTDGRTVDLFYIRTNTGVNNILNISFSQFCVVNFVRHFLSLLTQNFMTTFRPQRVIFFFIFCFLSLS